MAPSRSSKILEKKRKQYEASKKKDIERKKNIGERNLTDSVINKDVGLIQVKE